MTEDVHHRTGATRLHGGDYWQEYCREGRKQRYETESWARFEVRVAEIERLHGPEAAAIYRESLRKPKGGE